MPKISKTSAKKASIIGNIRKKASERSGFHVISHNDGWVVKKEGTARSSAKFSSKDEAISSAARERIGNRKSLEIIVHNKDGLIEGFVSEKSGCVERGIVSNKNKNIEGKVKR